MDTRHTAIPWVWNAHDQLVSSVARDDNDEPSLIIETDGGFYPPNSDDREFIACACNAHDGLVAALERLRAGRITTAISDRLSDTEMARIADEALKATGLGGVISPAAKQIIAL